MSLDPYLPTGTVVQQGVFNADYKISIGHDDTREQLEAQTLEIMQTVLREAAERYRQLVVARWPRNTLDTAAIVSTTGASEQVRP